MDKIVKDGSFDYKEVYHHMVNNPESYSYRELEELCGKTIQAVAEGQGDIVLTTETGELYIIQGSSNGYYSVDYHMLKLNKKEENV